MTTIRGPRLDLVLLSGELNEALLARDLELARQLAPFSFPDDFPREASGLIALRHGEVVADPTWAEWSLRAMVLRAARQMVGFANFHGPPGINDVGAAGAAEIGYTVFPDLRRRGYATEACQAMLEWAHREHGVTHFISGIEPSNAPSLRVIEKLGFTPLGLLIEGEAIFERRLQQK
jgi:RimJ/RimL family protein N-acetyltransferase